MTASSNDVCIYSAEAQPARKKQKRQVVANKEKKTTKKQVRQLKVQERQAVVKSVDKQKLVTFVRDCVPASLVPSLFPERM